MNRYEYQKYIDDRNAKLIEHLATQREEIEIKFDKYSLLLAPNVFNPLLGEGTEIMYKCKRHLYGKNVLEIGTGSGILSILSAEKSNKITATDISPVAVQCARKNIRTLKLDAIIEVRHGDLFCSLNRKKFDKIIFNPPFIEGVPSSLIEYSYYDNNYETLTRFFCEAKEYLTNEGEIILCFGSAGDIDYLNWLILTNGFKMKFIANELINNLQFFVYKISQS